MTLKCETCGSTDVVQLFTSIACNKCDPPGEQTVSVVPTDEGWLLLSVTNVAEYKEYLALGGTIWLGGNKRKDYTVCRDVMGVYRERCTKSSEVYEHFPDSLVRQAADWWFKYA